MQCILGAGGDFFGLELVGLIRPESVEVSILKTGEIPGSGKSLVCESRAGFFAGLLGEVMSRLVFGVVGGVDPTFMTSGAGCSGAGLGEEPGAVCCATGVCCSAGICSDVVLLAFISLAGQYNDRDELCPSVKQFGHRRSQ